MAGAKASKGRRARKPKQAELPFPSWGGARKGAGRKPKRGVAGMPHRPREERKKQHPLHVTLKLCAHLPRLRRKAEYAAVRAAFVKGKDRFGFRLCHYAVLNDHLHLVCEATDRTAVHRGVKGLAIRLARALNKLWARKGQVFADRYHDRALATPREVRNALAYVMGNARHHAAEGRMVSAPQAIDTYTSAPWFDGFRERFTVRGIEVIVRPTTPARTWLLDEGWRRHGLIPLAPTA